jgi:hypothetical protein
MCCFSPKKTPLAQNLKYFFFVSCSSNLKAKMQEEGVDKTWKLLVKKVTRARVMSALASREVPDVVKKSWAKSSSRIAARFR